jgi:hypothetical protein
MSPDNIAGMMGNGEITPANMSGQYPTVTDKTQQSDCQLPVVRVLVNIIAIDVCQMKLIAINSSFA